MPENGWRKMDAGKRMPENGWRKTVAQAFYPVIKSGRIISKQEAIAEPFWNKRLSKKPFRNNTTL
jgi:hypothetical protein